jgi:thioredoxin reductase (NADPH)
MGYVVLKGRTQSASKPGVFAAGDVSDPRYKQAGVAAGDGIKGGLDAVWWLSELGYNGPAAERMDPYFFDPRGDNKVEVEQINSVNDFENVLKKSEGKLIVVDFYASTCPSCMHMMPVVQWAATKLADEVVFLKVDAAIAFDLVKKFRAPAVPYFVVLKKGKIVGETKEVMDRSELYKFVKQFLK